MPDLSVPVATGGDGAHELRCRLRSALEELAWVYEFERFVVNDHLDTAVAEVRARERGEEAGRRPFDESARIDTLRPDLADALRVRMDARSEADSGSEG